MEQTRRNRGNDIPVIVAVVLTSTFEFVVHMRTCSSLRSLLKCVPELKATRIAIIVVTLGAVRLSGMEPTGSLKSPSEVVHAYADAANRGDLETFIALYAPDVKKYRFPGTLAAEGREHMRETYRRSFAEKNHIHVEIVSALTLGDKVVCRDHVTGLPGGKTAEELTVYQVENGLITNIVYVDRIEQ